MKSLRHRLPPLNSLMVFEAAARTLSFTQAAKELHVTQAAVSKQIKFLEQHLDFALFERHGRKVSLSSRGEKLLQKVSTSLNYLADAVDELTEADPVRTVTVAANTAMSHYWLSGAINDFYQQHSGYPLNIRVITSDHTPELFGDEVNLAVVYDQGSRPGWSMHELFAEELFPVASPDYLRRHPSDDASPEALLSHQLLEYERIEPNWINWRIWFEALDLDIPRFRISRYFNNYIVLIDAAERGQGVTLGSRYLLDNKLRSGSLVRLTEFSMHSGRSYFLAVNEARPQTEEVRLIHQWLVGYQP
ncbi:LysR substrate-binding domain-containing protein [Zobellella maritima]|uniref:LysR substrate-binding domain-containing protein n=1 Tax=Zobellella maritima TaxID=2059725 RepID=UPI000E30263A|nr:LysR substrate-binding domain-containing protein [Zobellella maritima]